MVNNGITEQSPLLSSGRDTQSGNVDAEPSTGKRIQKWIARHVVYIVLTLLLLLFFILFLVQAIRGSQQSDSPKTPSPEKPEPEPEKICTSAGCVLASSNLLRSLAPNYKDLNACDDFRTFTCAGFDAAHEIRADQSSVGSLQLMNEENQLILKRILEAPAPESEGSLFWTASTADKEIFNKMKDGYNACMNETLLATIGSRPLLNLLEKLDEVYPAKKPKKSRVDVSLTNAVEFLMSIGVASPVSIGVGADDKDPDVNIISVSAPYSFGLPSKQYYNRTEIVTAYKETIAAVLEALLKEARPKDAIISIFRPEGIQEEDTQHEDHSTLLSKGLVDDLVAFEKSMASIAPDPEDAADVTKFYNPRTLEEADSYNTQISVKHIIKNFTNYTPSTIIVGAPEYLKDLSKILESTDRKTIQAYLAWKVVQSWGGAVEDDAVKPLRQFGNKLAGRAPDAKQERWRTCASTVGSDLAWILSRFFVERAFSKEAKELGDQIIHDIKDEFTIELNKTEWMTPNVRQLAIDKVHLIRQKIGYPTRSPDVTSADDLQKYYKNIKITSTTYFANKLSVVKDDVKRSWAQAGKPVDKDEWGMSAQTVNAYYNPPGNEIVFPAGIMQAPVFYDPSIPKYLSYGAFGAVAGHELGHAFDSSGRYYDQIGNYTDWWDESTITAFKSKTDCFVKQYQNYTIPTKNGPLPINGKLTLGENVADSSGLHAAFQSWRRRDEETPDLLLPGLQDFTKEQIFFLAYGLTWCGKTREEQMIQRLYSDPHSPDFVRIAGTTANSREFREAFNCPVKEPTCELWG